MINPSVSYAGKTTAPDASYPYGGAQNITAPGDGTGTPWEAALVNDLFGLTQAALSAASIVPSGSPETAEASQFLDAVTALLQPVGAGLVHYGTAAPTGFLVCDGSEVDKTTFAALFAVIGTTWDTTGGAAAPAVGNFRLPPQELNGKGIFTRGVGAFAVGDYSEDALQGHYHAGFVTGGVETHLGSSVTAATETLARVGGATAITDGVNGTPRLGSETVPNSITALMCIKF